MPKNSTPNTLLDIDVDQYFPLWALDIFLYIWNVKRFKALSFEPGSLETITQDISKESQTFKPLIPYF